MRFRLVARLAGMGVPGEFWREVSNCESENGSAPAGRKRGDEGKKGKRR